MGEGRAAATRGLLRRRGGLSLWRRAEPAWVTLLAGEAGSVSRGFSSPSRALVPCPKCPGIPR